MSTATAASVADWMLGEVRRQGVLYQADAVFQIEANFGEAFVYDNDNGNRAISPDVLSAFREISDQSVVWNKRERFWRLREPEDEIGRSQPC
jgi:hypothetical protein